MEKSLNKGVDKYKIWVWVLSISIPIVVAILFLIRIPNVDSLTFLPPIYAAINAATSKGTSLLIHRSISTEIILLKSSSEKQIMQNQRTLLTTSKNAKSAIDTKRYNCICSPNHNNPTLEQRDFATSCHLPLSM